MPSADPPLFSFGLVADVQYSDMVSSVIDLVPRIGPPSSSDDDGHTESRTQRYREAPAKLKDAVQHWLGHGDISFVISLGDIINGNSLHPEKNVEELETVAAIFDQLGPAIPVHHVIGNHCLSVSRDHLLKRLKLPGSYYSVQLPAQWHLIVLDTTEMSGHSGLPTDSEAVSEAAAFKAAHPLSAEEPQMADWNGGISSKQMRWLKEELRCAEEAGRKIIVTAHHQAGLGGARNTHLAWNWKEINSLLTGVQCTKLYMAGHDHKGGYTLSGGIHWLTVEAILEAMSGGNAFAVARVYSDRLEIKGHGVTSRVLAIREEIGYQAKQLG